MRVTWHNNTIRIRPESGDDPADVTLLVLALRHGNPIPGNVEVVERAKCAEKEKNR